MSFSYDDAITLTADVADVVKKGATMKGQLRNAEKVLAFSKQ
jgi:hypothetical protein